MNQIDDNSFTIDGNFVITPHCIYNLIPHLTNAELRILLIVCRKTFGFRKNRDKIANSQFHDLAGLSLNSVRAGLAGLLEKDIIYRHVKGNFKTISEYSINRNFKFSGVQWLRHTKTEVQQVHPRGQTTAPLRGEPTAPTKETINKVLNKDKKFKIPIIEKSKYEPQTPLAKQWANYEIRDVYRRLGMFINE